MSVALFQNIFLIVFIPVSLDFHCSFLHQSCCCLRAYFPGDSNGKISACNAGDPGSIWGQGRSPGVGNGKPLQYSCLENSMDRGPWRAIVQGLQRVWQDWVTNTFTFRAFKSYAHSEFCFFRNTHDSLSHLLQVITQKVFKETWLRKDIQEDNF